MMDFRLGGRPLRAEVPLLAHDFPERLPAVSRPAQNVRLRALGAGFNEVQRDPPKRLWLQEDKPDRLFSGPSSAPTRGQTGQQRGLNWMSSVLRSDLHLRDTLHIQ